MYKIVAEILLKEKIEVLTNTFEACGLIYDGIDVQLDKLQVVIEVTSHSSIGLKYPPNLKGGFYSDNKIIAVAEDSKYNFDDNTGIVVYHLTLDAKLTSNFTKCKIKIFTTEY